MFAYFAGIALVGGALGALFRTPCGRSSAAADPPALLIVGAAVAGAIAAMFLQRYVIVVGTAFGGAWTIVVGADVDYRRSVRRRERLDPLSDDAGGVAVDAARLGRPRRGRHGGAARDYQ